MKKTLTILVAACGLSAVAALRSITPFAPALDVHGGKWWHGRHATLLERAKSGDGKIVFLGDSITQGWEGAGKRVWERYFAGGRYHAINLGISGDRTEHVLWRIANGELDGYAAKAIVLVIGTNNTGHFKREDETPEDTVLGIKAVLEAIRAKQPGAMIVLCPIFPRGRAADDQGRLRNAVVNKAICKFANGRDIFWCDFTDQFLAADGTLPAEIMPDYLHPREYGYEMWANAVLPFLDAAIDGSVEAGFRCHNRYASRLSPAEFALDGPMEAMAMSAFPKDNHWGYRCAAKRAEIVDGPKQYDLVFVGDSITHSWERAPGSPVLADLRKTYSVLVLGYGGDRTQHVLWRMENGELDGYTAKLFMLMIGTNNEGRPENVAAGIRKIVSAIRTRHPEAKVLLLPIFPRGATPQDERRVRNEKVNAVIKGYADGRDVFWADFNAKFLEPDGTLTREMMGDLLHPGTHGYEIWRDSVLPVFREVVGK